MRVLILSDKGEGYEIISKLAQEGHDVVYWVQDPQVNSFLVDQGVAYDQYKEHIETTDLTIGSSSGVGGRCEEIREGDGLVLGGRLQGVLEMDQEFALGVARVLSLTIAPPPKQGISITLCGFFSGERWGDTFVVQNYRRLLDGERGPLTSSMGYLAWKEGNLLHQLEDFLTVSNYQGFLGVKIEVVDDVPYFCGFVGYPDPGLLAAIQECAGVKLYQLLASGAKGEKTSTKMDAAFGIAVKLYGASYLQSDLKITPQAAKHYWPTILSEDLGYVSARGDSPREARRRTYRTINNICPPEVIFRTDIGLQSIWEWRERNNERVDTVKIRKHLEGSGASEAPTGVQDLGEDRQGAQEEVDG